MAKNPVTIAGEEIDLQWTQRVARQYRFRASKAGIKDEILRLQSPTTVESALFEILWCIVPEEIVLKHPSPESLFMAVDHESEGAGIWQAVKTIIEDQIPDAQKKMSSESKPSPESNSE